MFYIVLLVGLWQYISYISNTESTSKFLLRVHKMHEPSSDPNRGSLRLPRKITGSLVTQLHYIFLIEKY